MIGRWALLLGWLATLAIVIASLVPIELRPHLLRVSQLEHFIAYFAAGAVFAMGIRRRRNLIMAICSLSILAGVLEIAQIWVPGRNSRIIDWVASSLGAMVGAVAIVLVVSAIAAVRRA